LVQGSGWHERTVHGVAGRVAPTQKEYLDIAVKNIGQLNRMIGDLLDSTRADVGKLQFDPVPTAVDGVIEDVLKTFRSPAAEKSILLRLETAPPLPSVMVDPARLRQVLMNLVDNGLKFTPAEGVITLRAGIFDQDPTFVRISVADTGPGVSSEDRTRIFQRLQQSDQSTATSRQGLGLGLYIAKEIVVRHHGTIWVEGEPGKGSVFSFTLPTCEARRDSGLTHAP
jgi:signal transduction histidine kinase